MSILSNPRHERFARELAAGKTAEEAYAAGGYRPSRQNTHRLLTTNDDIRARLAELQGKAATKAVVTVESLCAELDEAKAAALKANQPGAAVSAIMGKAKLLGLIVDKKQVTGKDERPIQTQQVEERCAYQASIDKMAEILASPPKRRSLPAPEPRAAPKLTNDNEAN